MYLLSSNFHFGRTMEEACILLVMAVTSMEFLMLHNYTLIYKMIGLIVLNFMKQGVKNYQLLMHENEKKWGSCTNYIDRKGGGGSSNVKTLFQNM